MKQKLFYKARAVINMTNAVVLSRLNGSIVVSGFPKTGTTYLSHLAERATGKTYIEGSMRFALRPSVVHTHSRRIPAGSVFSYRPIDTVIPSLVTQRLQEVDPSFSARIRSGDYGEGERSQIRRTVETLLIGTSSMPAPSAYYRSVREKGGVIVNILDLSREGSPARAALQEAWRVPAGVLSSAIDEAERLSQQRRAQGHEFYNRPTDIVRSILEENAALKQRIADEASRTRDIVEGAKDA